MKVPIPLLATGYVRRCLFETSETADHFVPLEPFEYNNWKGCSCPDKEHGLTLEQMQVERFRDD